MRILKQKISLALKRLDSKTPSKANASTMADAEIRPRRSHKIKKLVRKVKCSIHDRKKKKRTEEELEKLVSKNMIKNYGRAIANFASSSLAIPYMDNLTKGIKFDHASFMNFSLSLRDFIQNDETLKLVIIPQEGDSEEDSTFKRIFRELAIVFIKYFSFNWIFNGRLQYKQEYLKFRGNMLRKLRNAESIVEQSPQS